ncbi:SDR family oxidoreductase [Streptomyces sp. NRRL B-1347]|uniref:SDR family oxidoreductase n=1 Tax=Streptomyces sp. NRRL B-1347 TaxID=1476877 RepID=UPI00068C8B80|nr:SDR family oxidoreductase [Streptomyces sp. NRRL B-1347]
MTELLLARGDHVAATARRPETLADLAERHGDRLWTAPRDVTDAPAVRRTVDAAFAALGRIDVIVSNAGYGLFGAAEEVTDEQIAHQIDTNLIGSIQLARAVIPHLRARGGGRIIQLSGMGGQIAFPALSLYHATKWGIEGFYEALSPEVAPFGIQTTLVQPGAATTDFGGRSATAAQAMAVYDAAPVGALRRAAAAGAIPVPGDTVKMARAIIDSADTERAPRRLLLGSDAYQAVTTALAARLTGVEEQKELAHSTDTTA